MQQFGRTADGFLSGVPVGLDWRPPLVSRTDERRPAFRDGFGFHGVVLPGVVPRRRWKLARCGQRAEGCGRCGMHRPQPKALQRAGKRCLRHLHPTLSGRLERQPRPKPETPNRQPEKQKRQKASADAILARPSRRALPPTRSPATINRPYKRARTQTHTHTRPWPCLCLCPRASACLASACPRRSSLHDSAGWFRAKQSEGEDSGRGPAGVSAADPKQETIRRAYRPLSHPSSGPGNPPKRVVRLNPTQNS